MPESGSPQFWDGEDWTDAPDPIWHKPEDIIPLDPELQAVKWRLIHEFGPGIKIRMLGPNEQADLEALDVIRRGFDNADDGSGSETKASG